MDTKNVFIILKQKSGHLIAIPVVSIESIEQESLEKNYGSIVRLTTGKFYYVMEQVYQVIDLIAETR